MRVLVPYDPRDPNTRLSPLLDPDERRAFAAVLCEDVRGAIRRAGGTPELLATAPVECSCPVHVDERSLSTAVNAVLADASGPVAVVMADLGLATPESLEGLFAAGGDVVVAPGLGGGTNALVVRASDFRVDYHGGSYRKHLAAASACGATLTTVDSFRLAVDVDEPADLVELLLHGEGAAPAWLRDTGFELDATGGRTTIRRANSPT